VDPLIQYPLNKNGGLDKPGKDNDHPYRGVAYICAAIDPRTGVCRSAGS